MRHLYKGIPKSLVKVAHHVSCKFVIEACPAEAFSASGCR